MAHIYLKLWAWFPVSEANVGCQSSRISYTQDVDFMVACDGYTTPTYQPWACPKSKVSYRNLAFGEMGQVLVSILPFFLVVIDGQKPNSKGLI